MHEPFFFNPNCLLTQAASNFHYFHISTTRRAQSDLPRLFRAHERVARLPHRQLLRRGRLRRDDAGVLLMPLRPLSDPAHLPALDPAYAHTRPALGLGEGNPPPRILLLYGSLRTRSFSRLATEEAARLLQYFGAETRIFDPAGLPFPDQVAGDDHP
jgi:hypothetical protein